MNESIRFIFTTLRNGHVVVTKDAGTRPDYHFPGEDSQYGFANMAEAQKFALREIRKLLKPKPAVAKKPS